MLSRSCIAGYSLYLVLAGLVSVAPALAGSAVIGSVAGSMNATVGGQTLLPNTTLFSGDSLQVKDGVAVVALGNASRMVFGHDTVASFLRGPNEITVLVSQGNISVFHDASGTPVRMKMGDVSVAPVSGFKTLGEVAMLKGVVIVTAKDGALRVDEGNGKVVNVAKGKTLTVTPQMRAPQGGGSAGRCCGGGGGVWPIVGTAAAGTAAILAGIAISRADDAKSNASSAASAAAAAASAAAGATSAAEAAASASAAAAAAQNAVGCALNTIYNSEGLPSPYTPPAGFSCLTVTTLPS